MSVSPVTGKAEVQLSQCHQEQRTDLQCGMRSRSLHPSGKATRRQSEEEGDDWDSTNGKGWIELAVRPTM